MRSGLAPGIVARTFTIFTGPIGVFASNACSVTSTPMAAICARMYRRVSSAAADPGGLGPKPTTARRCSIARPPSKAGGSAAVVGCTQAAKAVTMASTSVARFPGLV